MISKTGQAVTGTVTGGNPAERFSPPNGIATDMVLYLVDAAGHG